MTERPGGPDPAGLSVTERALQTLAAARTGLHRYGLVAALTIFVVGAFFSIRELDISVRPGGWWVLVAVAVLGVPPMILLNAIEIRLAGRMTGPYEVELNHAAEVAVTGTAANLLPIPGATLIRAEALNSIGVPAGAAFRANVAIGGIWVLISALVSAVLLIGYSTPAAVAAAALAGVSAIGVYAVTPRPISGRTITEIVVVETLALGLTALRLLAITWALGGTVSLRQTLVIAGSYALTSAVGIFPGGLGLREAISSGLAIVVGLPGAVGFLASAVDRLLGFLVHVPLILVLVARRRRNGVTSR